MIKIIRKFLLLTASPLIQETAFFVFMYILGSICILTFYNQIYTNGQIKMLGELFLDTYILTLLVTLVPSRIRKYIKWIILCILYLIAIIDIFCFTRFGTGISPNIIQLIIETNGKESSDFFNSYITLDIFKSITGIIILIFSIHIVFSIIKKRILCQPNVYIGFIILFLLIICSISSIKHKKEVVELFSINSNKELVEFFSVDLSRSRISYLPIYRLASSIHINSIERAQSSLYLQKFSHLSIDSCNNIASPDIILIIGESYNKHHSSLYGYNLPTTPFQVEEARSGRLFVFNDAVTPYNLTSEVFKNILSLNDCSTKEEWYEKPLFTQILKNSGYNVSFISNQYQAKDFNDFSAGAFIDNNQISKLQFCHRNNQLHEYDMGLLQEYDSLKTNNKECNLTIFHFVGQHIDYKNRFPQEYNSFSYTNYQRTDLTREEISIISDYDNATRYNDEVLKQIITTFIYTNTIILFLSDHGEECFDEIHTFGRQHDQELNPFVAKNEFEIPFWIWCSDEYKEKHKEIVSAIKESTKLPFYSSDLGHIILYLAGIKSRYYKAENNILDKRYNSHRKRLLKGGTSYEELMKYK